MITGVLLYHINFFSPLLVFRRVVDDARKKEKEKKSVSYSREKLATFSPDAFPRDASLLRS